MRRYKTKLVILLVLIVLLTAVELTFPGNPQLVISYDKWIFRPYQSFRNIIFGWIHFSVGDILYILAGLYLVWLVLKWVYFLARFMAHRHDLATSFLYTLSTLAGIYILFVIGWGANYYKPRLSEYWELNKYKTADSVALVNYDKYLIGLLNEYAPHYHALSFREVSLRTEKYYKEYTDSKTKFTGLGVKPSLFGVSMEYMGVQGYYNPFTGESQVNRFLPPFMLPFVVCHEMAHQTGIANEGDANLLAYVIGTAADDSSFRYSCYFNTWLYTNVRVRQKDPKLAKQLKAMLNPLSQSHIDTLRAIRRRYEGGMSKYSGEMYDRYLRLHDQKGGIDSYEDVVMNARAWDEKKKTVNPGKINIP